MLYPHSLQRRRMGAVVLRMEEECHNHRMTRDSEDTEQDGYGGGGVMVSQGSLVDLTKPQDSYTSIDPPIGIHSKTPSVLEDMEFILPEGLPAEPASCPPSPEALCIPLVELPHLRDLDSTSTENLSTTLGKLRTLDCALDTSPGFSSYREDPVWRKVMRSRIKAPLQSDDDADGEGLSGHWYRDFAPSDLELIREAFVSGVEEYRDRHPYPCTPVMPSMLNPMRKEAPPRSWAYLENPYRFCRRWKMQAALHPSPSRSRYLCDQERRGGYTNPKHCPHCRRDTLFKSLLSSRFQERMTKAHLATASIQDRGTFFYRSPTPQRVTFPYMRWTPRVIDLESFEDDDDDDMQEVAIQAAGKSDKDECARRVRLEFSYDYRDECPESPRLLDLDEISDTSDDENLWDSMTDSMDWDDDEDFSMDS